MIDLWYKEAIIYELDVETFFDFNGDGIGDFAGLSRRLDYLSNLGVTCLWLRPFYPTPNRDDGYDVADYYGIDSRLGTLGDFVEFVHLADQRGIRVIADLVANHTSDQHAWFQQSRRNTDSPFRDFYIWSEKKPEDLQQGMVYPPEQKSVWSYDEVAKAWYFHRFFHFQPDLNIANSLVREEIEKVVGFWLQQGLAGFRVDAVPFIRTQSGEADALRDFRRFLSWRRGDAMFLAEANVPKDDIEHYFGGGTRMHMLFSFLINQHLFLSLARHDARPLVEILYHLPELPVLGQWANFLRNHDELALDQISDAEREEVFRAFAPEEEMRAYGRGIRRRLAPMLGGDRRRLELAYSLLLSLPGTPVLRYGDEIGMGDNLKLPGRMSVRTPMQWSEEKNAGFSTAPAEKLVHPVISGGDYGYERVNVAAQRRDQESFLQWMKRAIGARKECPEFGRGRWKTLPVRDSAVLVHRCDWESGAVVAVHNLAGRPAKLKIDPERRHGEHLVQIFGRREDKPIDPAREIEIEEYGYQWYRVAGAGWKLP